jgi:glycosyltransferase involved in cell wall biosynthesis
MMQSAKNPKRRMPDMASPFTIFVPEIEAFGGAERSVIALSRWMYKRALPHRFLLYYDHIGLQRFSNHPIDLIALNPTRSLFGKVTALRRYFKGLPDGAPMWLMSGIQAATHASLVGIRGFHTLMYDPPSLLNYGFVAPSLGKQLRRVAVDKALARGLKSGGATIVTSEYVRDEAIRLWHPSVVIARMGGIPAKHFRPRVVDKKMRMLSVCRVESNKRIDWILNSLTELEKRTPSLGSRVDWHLDIVGGGSQIGQLSTMADQLGLRDRVTFHGFVPDERLEDHYDRADLFLMPALQGYGLPAAEALARGIPVLLHRDSGISDLLLDTPWAVVMYGDTTKMPEALDRSIDSLLSNSHLGVPLPEVPTQDQWAEQVVRCCGWIRPDD